MTGKHHQANGEAGHNHDAARQRAMEAVGLMASSDLGGAVLSSAITEIEMDLRGGVGSRSMDERERAAKTHELALAKQLRQEAIDRDMERYGQLYDADPGRVDPDDPESMERFVNAGAAFARLGRAIDAATVAERVIDGTVAALAAGQAAGEKGFKLVADAVLPAIRLRSDYTDLARGLTAELRDATSAGNATQAWTYTLERLRPVVTQETPAIMAEAMGSFLTRYRNGEELSTLNLNTVTGRPYVSATFESALGVHLDPLRIKPVDAFQLGRPIDIGGSPWDPQLRIWG